jgi:hypothetical protein
MADLVEAMGKQPTLSEVMAKAAAKAEALPRSRGTGQGGRGVHSPLFLWIMKNREGLKVAIDRYGWDALAAAVGEAGIVDGLGRAPGAKVLRHTWFRVNRAASKEQALAEARQRRKARRTPARMPEPAKEPEAKPQSEPESDEDRPHFDYVKP